MRKLLIITILLFICLFFVKSTKAYDPTSVSNNIYGIGIINHSDIVDVSRLVNTSGGDWGYVTIVITENQRDKDTWQKFFDQCRSLHLIPIIRIASKFDTTTSSWEIPDIKEIDRWINFLNSLNWVIENRYVVIGNEPNHAKEWGGKLDPAGYAVYLKTFSQKLKDLDNNYFVLNAGFDQSAPNSKITMDQKKYMELMIQEVPEVFNYIDGWASHSYPNPNFSGSEKAVGRKSIKGYEWELQILKGLGVARDLPVFITETGWIRNKTNEKQIAEKTKYAFENVWSKDKKIVAVTPFILNYTDEPFSEFSWKKNNTEFYSIFDEIKNIQKISGKPIQKIKGEVIFKFLNPLSLTGTFKKGYALVRNTGQSIWEKTDVTIQVSNNKFEINTIEINNINPYSTGLLIYSIKFPDTPDLYDLNLGFLIKDKKIGDVFNGKIISY